MFFHATSYFPYVEEYTKLQINKNVAKGYMLFLERVHAFSE